MPGMRVQLGVLGGVIALWGFAGLCACGPPDQAIATSINVETVGRAGGVLVGQGDLANVQLSVPFGALSQDTPLALGVDPAPPPPPPGLAPASASVLLSPEGLALAKPATLFLPYTGLSDVSLYTAPAIAGATWQPFDGGQADPSENVIRASIPHFSRWCAFRPAVDVADGG